MSIRQKHLKFIVDLAVTTVLWIYFISGITVVPVYAAAYLFSKDRQRVFQKMNHRFFKGFFWLTRSIVPGLTIDVDKRILDLQSCVVISNHRSYLDPLILVAAFEKQCTIVKGDFLRLPVFGWIIKTSGYIPEGGNGRLSVLVTRRIKSMNDYLSGGGVLFVFPEGTRSRDGRLGPFSSGAFKIARRCSVPVEVLCITNTDKLFAPGRFLFNTCVDNRIEVRWLGRIYPDKNGRTPINTLMTDTRNIMESNLLSR